MSVLLQQPVFVLLAASAALGLFLMVAAQPIGRPRPDLATRLRELDPDEWLLDDMAPPPAAVLGVPLIDALLRPLVDDVARLTERVARTLGLTSPRELERRLQLAAPGTTPLQYYGEKVTVALAFEVILLVTHLTFDLLRLPHGGPWPLWAWLGAGALGFIVPDLAIGSRLAERRMRIVCELPTLLDLLAIAARSGRSLQQAVADVAPFLAGPLGDEWARLGAEVARTPGGLPVALRGMALRNGVPEVESLAEQLIAAHAGGHALAPTLEDLATARRQERLHAIEAEGARATERMFLPVAVFVLVPLLLVVAIPAGVSLFGALR